MPQGLKMTFNVLLYLTRLPLMPRLLAFGGGVYIRHMCGSAWHVIMSLASGPILGP